MLKKGRDEKLTTLITKTDTNLWGKVENGKRNSAETTKGSRNKWKIETWNIRGLQERKADRCV